MAVILIRHSNRQANFKKEAISMLKHLLVTGILFISSLAFAGNPQVHVDEPAGYTEKTRFSAKNAISSLNVVRESLDSFKKIVEAAGAEEPIILQEYQYTDWEMQNIGLPNMVSSIEGTIRKQSYINAKLEYDLAVAKNNDKAGSKGEILRLKKIYLDRKKEYTDFVKNMRVID
jgi:hypothetical protein